MRMVRIFLPFIILIAAISIFFNFKYFKKDLDNNRVTEVVDGDTFQLKSGVRVRLMGIDAPEFGNCGSEEAKKKLSELILDKNVELKETVEEKFGRSLALVYQNGTLVNKIMMEEGWGRPDYRKNSQRDVLTSAYHTAQDKKLGLYGFCIDPKNPPNCTIKGNIDIATSEKFYHLPYCRHYSQTHLNTAFGEGWFCNEQEALKAGFVKSPSCDQ